MSTLHICCWDVGHVMQIPTRGIQSEPFVWVYVSDVVINVSPSLIKRHLEACRLAIARSVCCIDRRLKFCKRVETKPAEQRSGTSASTTLSFANVLRATLRSWVNQVTLNCLRLNTTFGVVEGRTLNKVSVHPIFIDILKKYSRHKETLHYSRSYRRCASRVILKT